MNNEVNLIIRAIKIIGIIRLIGIFIFLAIFINLLYAQNQDQRWDQLKGNNSASDSANANTTGASSSTLGKLINTEGLNSIKIHEGGRVKPFDSFARSQLLILSGRSTFNGQSATKWLAELMFSPEANLDNRVFKINNDEILFALGIKPNKSRRYSYNEILVGSDQLFKIADFALSKVDKEQSSADKEFIRIYNNFAIYNRLMNNFLFALPVSTFLLPDKWVKEQLGLSVTKEYFSYLDIMEVSDLLKKRVKLVEAKKKSEWSAEDSFLWELEKKYSSFLNQVEPSTVFFIPSYTHGEMKWFSFTQVLRVASGENVVQQEIAKMKILIEAYRDGDQVNFDQGLSDYKKLIDEKIQDGGVFRRINAELFYNKSDLFFYASFLYGLAFLLAMVYIGVGRSWILYSTKGFLRLGFLLHLMGLVVRFVITERPPITNLFETFIFVGFSIVAISFLLEWFNKRGLGVVIGGFGGLAMLLISNKFGAEGDTLEVLVAVLRSNFWLSTHVVTINLGYGGVVISGVVGHIYLIYKYQLMKKELGGSKEEEDESRGILKNIARMTYATQGFGIIFTLIGTVLGGVWADQSWGRFWGWDPKENGSLLIVLWSAILFHARMGGMIKDLGFNVGSIIGIIVVMMAWFGINLLGVGLHSYGFTSGIAKGLFTYVALQFIFIFGFLALLEYRKQKLLKS